MFVTGHGDARFDAQPKRARGGAFAGTYVLQLTCELCQVEQWVAPSEVQRVVRAHVASATHAAALAAAAPPEPAPAELFAGGYRKLERQLAELLLRLGNTDVHAAVQRLNEFQCAKLRVSHLERELEDSRRATRDARDEAESKSRMLELYQRLAQPPDTVSSHMRVLAGSEDGKKRLRAVLHPDKLPEGAARDSANVLRNALGL